MTHFGVCHLCEAMCGLAMHLDGDRVTRIRGDRDDPLSRGYMCPKAAALGHIHADAARLRGPVQRGRDGWQPVTWRGALGEVTASLSRIRREHGPDAIGIYLGNPVVHDYGAAFFAKALLRSLSTRHRFSAASVDGLPHLLTSYLMFGNQMLIPVPDIDRTQFFLCIGANPMVSNGSVMAAPGMPRRLAALRARGGRSVVVDPRRTETARLADAHWFIRPGTDALLLLAMISVVFEERLARDKPLFRSIEGMETIEAVAREFPPERVAGTVGIAVADIRRLTREFAAAPSAVCYGRVGVSTQEHGALACWLIQVLNLVTGNFDREGGAMFSRPALDLPALARWTGDRGHFATFHSSVRRLPEFGGELPLAALADQIETEGANRIRALITFAGNPVLSAPNGRRLERALSRLDFFVAIDPYENATTRLAHVILPPPSPLERDHYPLISHLVAVRNTAKFGRRAFPPPPGTLHDWEILLAIKSGLDRAAPMSTQLFKRIENAVLARLGPAGLLDLGLRFGPYGFRRSLGKGLSLRRLRRAPHGVDLGPLTPGLERRLSRRPVNVAPAPLVDDVARLRDLLARDDAGASTLRLIGRRQVRTNNTWLHDWRDTLAGPRASCALLIHPRDAHARAISDGDFVQLRSRTGTITVRAELSADIMPGVVSLPHGWSGPSVNDVTDDQHVDRLAGTAAFNGTPVEVMVAVPHAPPHSSSAIVERTAI